MNQDFLVKLFEHNNWANLQIVEACLMLTDEQLDREPQSAMKGSIRLTLIHLVAAQQSYLKTLTLPLEVRREAPSVALAELRESITKSGEGLLSLAKGEQKPLKERQLETKDRHLVEPWVLMVQVINHATEHREQIKSMLTALGVTPPSVDGWDYAEVTRALIPIAK